ncbi:MAG: right-handed parallel beta-helix repeat-containing protein [Kofleriaceae bacterium]
MTEATAEQRRVLVTNGRVSIVQSEISGTVAAGSQGLRLAAGELTISCSKISNNTGGGILVATNQKVVITNSFIVGNTGAGGLNVPVPGQGSVVEFNTIADNVAGTGAAAAGGVFCDSAAFTFSNNIVYRNIGGPAPSFRQTFGNCQFTGSYVSPNDTADPTSLAFVKDTVPRDYHLTSASPPTVRNVATATCEGLVDYDGDPRPSGGACDLGADELKE